MGMDLIPVHEGDEGGGAGSILIDPATVQNMGIKTETVQRRDLTKTIRAVGTITYNEERLFTVNSKISGWIEKLYVNSTGQVVKKGQRLMDIYSPELVSAQEEYLLALKNKELVKGSSFDEIKNGAQSLLASTRKRLENWDIPANAIDQIEQRGNVTKTMTLTAPANGVVVHKNAVDESPPGVEHVEQDPLLLILSRGFDPKVLTAHKQSRDIILEFLLRGIISLVEPLEVLGHDIFDPGILAIETDGFSTLRKIYSDNLIFTRMRGVQRAIGRIEAVHVVVPFHSEIGTAVDPMYQSAEFFRSAAVG